MENRRVKTWDIVLLIAFRKQLVVERRIQPFEEKIQGVFTKSDALSLEERWAVEIGRQVQRICATSPFLERFETGGRDVAG